jgi:hypothetical protein
MPPFDATRAQSDKRPQQFGGEVFFLLRFFEGGFFFFGAFFS